MKVFFNMNVEIPNTLSNKKMNIKVIPLMNK